MLNKAIITFLLLLLSPTLLQASLSCGNKGVWLQVLGSGGPELDDGRASSGYLIWQDGRARVMVDMGTGSLLNFEKSTANLNDLDIILMSHFHVDHSNDLPALIKASFFTNRRRDLPLYGPTDNHLMPSATAFIQNLFSTTGAFRYLGTYIDGSDTYRLIAHDVSTDAKAMQQVTDNPYKISAVPVHHGPIPSLAWRVNIGGKRIVFSGDMNNANDTLTTLAQQADLLVAHHAIPESAGGIARNLHMPPSVIGQVAAKAQVKQLVLSHRMQRTLGREVESARLIREAYSGPLMFAEDLQCFQP